MGETDGDNQAASAAAPKKRTLDNDNQQQSNKRRKKNKGKNKKKNKGHHNAHHGNNQRAKHKKQNNNWIENCSESVGRIPSNCAAPLTCVITRVEIDEEPLLPKGVKGEDGGRGESAEDCIAGDGKGGTVSSSASEQKDLLGTAPSAEPESLAAPPLKGKSNIAKPSLAFVSQYTKDREPWKVPSTIEVDNEQKKLFISVKRHASAKGPTKWAQQRKKSGKQQTFNHCHLPGGDNGDGILNPYPSVPDKFWAQRKRLFSRYDQGIQIGGEEDPEMWYSVTPESIANHVAERTLKMIRQSHTNGEEGGEQATTDTSCRTSPIIILDVFCGCGGNSIAFARLNNMKKQDKGNMHRVKVIAVDNNLSRLKMAANNAAIYKVDTDSIVFIHADAVEVLNYYCKGTTTRTAEEGKGEVSVSKSNHISGFALGGTELLPDNLDGIFLSPPWGGMDYGNQTCGKSGFDPVTAITVVSSSEETKEGVENEKREDTVVKTNGGELLSIAAKAVFDDSKQEGAVAYFLPRNTDGISLGQTAVASGIEGCFEMEQNVVNGKVKTVTAYFGHSAGEHL